MRRNIGIIGVAAAMAMGLAAGPGVDIINTPEPAPRRRARRVPKGYYDPQINRWTGKATRAQARGRAPTPAGGKGVTMDAIKPDIDRVIAAAAAARQAQSRHAAAEKHLKAAQDELEQARKASGTALEDFDDVVAAEFGLSTVFSDAISIKYGSATS